MTFLIPRRRSSSAQNLHNRSIALSSGFTRVSKTSATDEFLRRLRTDLFVELRTFFAIVKSPFLLI
jgi:hypothetical protein